MANQTITQLPAAGPITGTELVPIVQNGGTYQTTTAAIANSPTLTQTFLTESQELTLNNSRYLSVNTGLQLTDGGATSFLRINMTGAANSLNAASAGFIVKDGPNSVVSRSLTTSGPGISISNADGTGANPIFSLTGSVGSLANFSGLGVLALRPGGTIAGLTVTGTANQIAVTDGDGQFGNPTIGLANNPILPGTGSAKIPVGTNAQRPAGSNGEVRYNTDLAVFEGYSSGSWLPFQAGATVNSFSAGTTGFSPSSPTTGAVVLTGTLNVSNGGTGATSLTGYVKGSGTSAFTASPTVPYTDVSGLGTIVTQNANNVALTGGTISGVGINNSIIGAATPAAGTFTSVAMTTGTISTAPVSGNDIVNKTYADSIASGINFHQSCSYATTAALPSVTYNNGSSGVGATLTATANGALVIDSYTFVSPGDIGKRVLIKNQANQAQNGVYTVTQVGNGSTPFILTRATDFDSAGPGVDQIDAGDFFLITSGTANTNTSWVQQTPLPITVGTTAIVFTQFGAPLTYSAGTGLNESPAYTFNIANTGVAASTYGSASQVPVFAVNAQGQLTSVTNTPIAISAGAVSGLAPSATTDTTNASNITSGTLGTSRLSGSYTGITGVGTLGFGTWNATPIGVAYGGTGLTSTPTDGQLPIGNGTGYTLATLTAGTNVFINNTSGGITISATAAAGGTVTSVDVSGGTTGLTTSGGPVTVSGTITLGGTLNVANGGTGATTLTGYVKGNGTSAMTASAAIPNTDITGLGTMSTQNAGTVAITGGSIEGTTVGSTTAATVRGTTVTATTEFSGPGTGLTGNASGLSIGGNAANVTGTVAVANGGTGQTTYTDGQLLIGNSSGNTLTKATLTAGSNISITNGNGSITIASTGGGSSYQVGEVILSTAAPTGGTWLETGKYYSKATYPGLAAVVGDVPDLGSVATTPQAQLPVAFAVNLTNSGLVYVTATDGTTTVVVGNTGAIRKTTDGTNWVPVPSGTTNTLNAVAYANSNFVAVGASGTIISSVDGTNWVTRTTPTSNQLVSIAFGNGRYVAVGLNGTIIYSSDLITWTVASNTGANSFFNAVYANSLFVAVGNAGACYTSSDGINWTSRSAGSNSFLDVIYGNSLFVAVGVSGTCYTSSDGITWTSRSAGSNQFNNIICANNLFVAVGNSNTIYTSTDGITWTSRTSGFNSTSININSVCWNGTNFVIVANGSRWATSSDGVTWSANVDICLTLFLAVAVVNGKTIAFGATASVILAGAARTEVFFNGSWGYTVATQSATNPRIIAYNGSNQYVAAGSNGIMLASSDGQAWSAYNTGVATNFDKVQYVNGNYIAMGAASGGFLTSPDGTTWTSRTTPTGTDIGNSAAFGSSTYVIVSATSTTNGYIYSSTDLVTWTTRVTETIPFYDCIFENGLFVAVGGTGNGSTGSGICYTSSNGTTWTQRSTTGLVGWNRVIYGNGLYVVVGRQGYINTSPNGITWTNRTTGVTAILNDVVWNGSIFCAVGASGTILTSPDGITWTARTPGDTSVTLVSISWNGTRFVVTNSTNGVAWVSTDGITWTRASTAFRSAVLYSAYLGGKFLAINGGFIQTSTDGLAWRNCDHVQYVPNSVSRLYKLGSYYYALSNGGLFESSDGITFTIADRTLPPTTAVAMAYSGSAWVLVVSAASGQPQSFYKSTNGTTWSKSADFGTFTNTSTIAGAAIDINYANGNFISAQTITAAQNITAGIYTSSDGVTWTGRVLPYGASIGFSGTISSDGTNAYAGIDINGQILKSTDGGVTWAALAANVTSGRATIYLNGYLICSTFATSDGSTLLPINSVSVQSLVYGYGNFAYALSGGGINRGILNLKSGTGFNIVAPASVLNFSFNTGTSKEMPVRGTTLLLPGGTLGNDRACYLIGEIPLRSYNTSTTFWVPPAGTATGQTAYIYAGA